MAGTIRRALHRSRLTSEYYTRRNHEGSKEIKATKGGGDKAEGKTSAEVAEARDAHEAEHEGQGGVDVEEALSG